jgi:hypothetical protein
MMQPCRNCGALIPASVARCPNCGAGFYGGPPPPPAPTLSGQSGLDPVLGMLISVFAPPLIASLYFTPIRALQWIGFHLPFFWWLGTAVAWIWLRKRYRSFAVGLLVGVLLWLVIGLGIWLLIMGLTATCSEQNSPWR